MESLPSSGGKPFYSGEMGGKKKPVSGSDGTIPADIASALPSNPLEHDPATIQSKTVNILEGAETSTVAQQTADVSKLRFESSETPPNIGSYFGPRSWPDKAKLNEEIERLASEQSETQSTIIWGIAKSIITNDPTDFFSIADGEISVESRIGTLRTLIEITKDFPIYKSSPFRIIYNLSINKPLKKQENARLQEELLFMCADLDPFTLARYIRNFNIQSEDLLNKLYSACEAGMTPELQGMLKLHKNNFTPIADDDFHPFSFTNYDIKLNHTPRLPIGSNKMLLPQMEAWVAEHPPEAQETARTLINSIKHVSMNEFAEKLGNTMKALEQMLEGEESKKYIFMVTKNKSTQWITELGLPLLSKNNRPVDVTSVYYDSYLEKLCEFYLKDLEKDEYKTAGFPPKIVLLDDGIYSGSQMSDIVQMIIETTMKVQRANPHFDIPFPDIYVAPVYATNAGIEFIKSSFPKTPIDILEEVLPAELTEDELMELSTAEQVQLIQKRAEERETNELSIDFCRALPQDALTGKLHILPFEKIETLAEAIPDKDMQRRVTTMNFSQDHLEDAETFNANGVHSRGNVYFDFKTPDFLSFPEALDKGIIQSEQGYFLKNISLIPKTIPPYKSAFLSYLKTQLRKNHD